MAFFGLTPEYRLQLYTQIHEIVFHGKGGYTWWDVYNLPISTRRFVYNKILEHYENSNKQENAVEQGRQAAESLKKETPPSYRTKVSQK